MLRGKLTHTLGTEKSTLQAGDYVVVPPRVAHGWKVDPSGDAYLLIRRDGPADEVFVQPWQDAVILQKNVARTVDSGDFGRIHAYRAESAGQFPI